MQLSQIKISKLLVIFLLFIFTSAQPCNAQETDILDFLPAILAAAVRNADNNGDGSKSIGSGGGTISSSSNEGSEYHLVVPPGNFLSKETVEISMTPISSMEGLPVSGEFLAAVNLEPEGLRLFQAKLTIKLVGTYTKDQLVAYVYDGDGENISFIPIENYDPITSTVTLNLYHFSGAGVATGSTEDIQANLAPPDTDLHYRQRMDLIERQGSADPLGETSTVFIDWYKNLLANLIQNIENFDLESTRYVANDYAIWLAEVLEYQCKIQGGCYGIVPACFAQSGLSPLLDDIREYTAEKFVNHYASNIEGLSQQCSAANDTCDKKALIEEGMIWKEMSQLGGVTADPCRGTGETVHFGGYFCEDAHRSIVGNVIFSEAPSAMLYEGGQGIYNLTAFDMFGEEIVYSFSDQVFDEVWAGLNVEWSTGNAQVLDAVDVTSQCLGYDCTKVVKATALTPGVANLFGTLSGEPTCGDPIAASMIIGIYYDRSPPNVTGGGAGPGVVSVETDITNTLVVSANDGEIYNQYGRLSTGTGIDHAEFYIDNNLKPGELLGVGPCDEYANSCEYTFTLEACYKIPTYDELNANPELTPYYSETYGVIVVDGRGNRSNYVTIGTIKYSANMPGNCIVFPPCAYTGGCE